MLMPKQLHRKELDISFLTGRNPWKRSPDTEAWIALSWARLVMTFLYSLVKGDVRKAVD